MISPRGGVCKMFINVLFIVIHLPCWLQGTQIPEIILVLLTAGMYSMCYSSSTGEVEHVLNILRLLQDYILWRRKKKHRPALVLHVLAFKWTVFSVCYIYFYKQLSENCYLFQYQYLKVQVGKCWSVIHDTKQTKPQKQNKKEKKK